MVRIDQLIDQLLLRQFHFWKSQKTSFELAQQKRNRCNKPETYLELLLFQHQLGLQQNHQKKPKQLMLLLLVYRY